MSCSKHTINVLQTVLTSSITCKTRNFDIWFPNSVFIHQKPSLLPYISTKLYHGIKLKCSIFCSWELFPFQQICSCFSNLKQRLPSKATPKCPSQNFHPFMLLCPILGARNNDHISLLGHETSSIYDAVLYANHNVLFPNAASFPEEVLKSFTTLYDQVEFYTLSKSQNT